MATFRIHKTNNYTVMSNYHFNDVRLSYKAMGLLSKMLSLPDNWVFTLQYLANQAKDGLDSVRAGIKELEVAGYIERSQSRSENGKFSKNVFNVYEHPHNTENSEVQPLLENPTTVVDSPSLDFPTTVNPTTEKSSTENPTLLNTYKLNTYKLNTYNNQSINQSNKDNKKIDRLIDLENYTELIKDNISYSTLCYDNKTLTEDIDEIINLMAEIVTFNDKPIKINNNYIPSELVKSRFLKIDHSDMQYILDRLSRNTTKVNNIRSYLISVIYNSKNTISNYYKAEVNHDLYGD